MAKATPRGGVKQLRTLNLAHTEAVAAGDIVISNGQVLVAVEAALANVAAAFIFRGPVSLPKIADEAVAVGAALYYDPANAAAGAAHFTAQPAVAAEGNTGDGTVDSMVVDSAALAETWTLTCTAVATVFSVVGSVSGAKADATVGTPYDNTFLNFTITQGAGANFAEDDAFTIAVTSGTKAGTAKEAAGAADTEVLIELGENK